MDGSGTTRVYERGKTRLRKSSWVASTIKHQFCSVDLGIEGSGGGFVSDDDDQLHVQSDGVDDDGQCSVGKCDSVGDVESNLLMADGGVVSSGGVVDDDTCGRNQCRVVRGGISVPLPLNCDLNEVPEVVVDEYALLDHCVSATPLLQCDLNEIPNVVADEVVSDHVISETLTFCDTGVEKREPVKGITYDRYTDANIDETELLRTKDVNSADFNNYKVQTDFHVHTRNTAAEEEYIGCGNRMNLQTPQQKPRRRKHRPRVLVDGYKPRVQKTKASPTIRKVKERLPNKKKLLSEIAPDVTEPIQSTRKSTRRPLDFDSMGFATDDWYPSNYVDVANFHIDAEARGEKRRYSSVISNSIDRESVGEYSPFFEISKRRRTTKRKMSLSSIMCWLSMAKFLSEPMVIKGCLDEIQRTMCPTPQAKRSKGFVRVRRLSFSSLRFKFFKRKYKAVRDLITDVRMQMHRKKRSPRVSKGKSWSNIIKMEQLYERKLVPYKYQRSPFKSRASAQDDGLSELQPTVDEIVERLQNLNINREDNVNYRRSTLLARFNSRLQGKDAYISSFDNTNGEEYALVPYRRDGTLVPFVKQKLPKPRVDLDAETSRVWNLLLEDINNPGIDGSDEETARKWSNERNVFRERANLFISRMHLIQGDRRFSPWKGSVLDSVIGVFLTQNVSDHLSSSAFMSLAAKFPCKQQSSDKMHHDKVADLSNDGIESSITNSSQNYVVIGQPVDDFDFENPVNSALALENFGNPRQFIDLRTGSIYSDGELGTIEISANSSSLETKENEVITTDGNVSAVNVSSQSSSDSFTQALSGVGLPCEIPVVNLELDTGYPSSNYSTYREVLEFSDSKEGCNTPTCDVSLERELDAVLSDVRSQSGGDILSLSRDFEVFQTLTNQQLHHTFEMGAENLEYMKNMEKRNTFSEGLYDLLKEQTSTSQNEDFTEHSRARSLSCQGACGGSEIDSCQCLISEISHNVEFHTIKGEHTTVHDSASRKKEADAHKAKTRRVGRNIDHTYDWDSLRKRTQETNKRKNSANSMDSIDYEALRKAHVSEIANVIKKRGMNAMLAERIQDFLNGLVTKHGSMNLEWLRDVLPDQAKEYLLTVKGLGLKSVECVRLLTLHQLAFPVDTNVGRIAVRLGWVPLQPLPESLQLHLLEQYPVLESIQKHLWPRLCKLDQKTLYELHYQMITFGKVFCTKTKPNCNSCPMRGDCRHFASEFASSRLALPSSKDKAAVLGISDKSDEDTPLTPGKDFSNLLQWFSSQREDHCQLDTIQQTERAHCEPVIEEPASPEPMCEQILDRDIEDIGMSDTSDCEDSVQIPTIKLNIAEFAQNLQNYVHENMEIQEAELSKALVALTPEAASIPPRKLKNASGLRTEHQVYVLPDDHPLLEKFDKREPDDPSPYLLAIWTPGETAKSIQPPEYKCNQEQGKLCNEETCLLCSSVRESEGQIVRGTILIPCRTAMRGSFPLNGTYFQVNEVFADFHSSHNPIEVPRNLIWDLQTRTVFFGTSVPTIFRGMVTEHIQQCFWKGYICVRGFDKETRAPRPLAPRLHTAKSLLPKPKLRVKKDTKPPKNAKTRNNLKRSTQQVRGRQ